MSFPIKSSAHNLLLLIGVLIIVAITFLLYGSILNAPFQFDDHDFILRNPSIRNFTDMGAVWGNLSQPSRFVPFLTFALNYQIHGYDPFGYHLVNVVIHILSGCAVWFIAYHGFQKVGGTNASEKNYALELGFCAALLFIVHPIQTQAISYITQRFASLAALFYLLSLGSYIVGRECMLDGKQGRCILSFLAMALFAVLGMFSKEFVMTLPLVIALYEISFFQQHSSFEWRRCWKWGLLIVPIMLIVPAIFSFRWQVLFNPRASSSHHGDMITFFSYVITQLRVFAKFLQLLIFPVSQNVEYDFALSHSLVDPRVLLASLLLIGVLYGAIRLWRNHRALSFGVFWIFLSLASHLVPRRYVIAEHKLYIASVGFCIAAVAILACYLRKKNYRRIAISMVLVAMAIACHQRNQVWTDPVLLWRDATQKSPAKPRAWLLLGQAYLDKGEYDDAIKAYDRALALDPSLARAYHNRGKIRAQQKDFAAALADYDNALRYDNRIADIYNNRGNALRHLGKWSRALKDYDEAIRRNPTYPEAYNNRGIVYKKMKKYPKAIADFSTAIEINPDYAVVYNNRGNLYFQLGDANKALQDYSQSIALSKHLPMTAQSRQHLAVAHMNRALCYARKQDIQNAYADARKAKELGYAKAQSYIQLWGPVVNQN